MGASPFRRFTPDLMLQQESYVQCDYFTFMPPFLALKENGGLPENLRRFDSLGDSSNNFQNYRSFFSKRFEYSYILPHIEHQQMTGHEDRTFQYLFQNLKSSTVSISNLRRYQIQRNMLEATNPLGRRTGQHSVLAYWLGALQCLWRSTRTTIHNRGSSQH